MLTQLKASLRQVLPRSVYIYLRSLTRPDDLATCLNFLRDTSLRISARERAELIRQFYRISAQLESPHTQREILTYAQNILSLPPGAPDVVLEAGCFKGSSTAKFSLAADLAAVGCFRFISRDTAQC